MPRGRLAEPPGQGTLCRVPNSPRSATLLDVLPSLEGQTTFKSDETKTITSVSKKDSQQSKNHVNTISVLQEKLQKSKKVRQKNQLQEKGGRPTRSPPPKEVGHWPTPTNKALESHLDDPRDRETPRTCFIRPLPTPLPV